jgi:hypothetical protein
MQGLMLFVPHGNAEYRAPPPSFYDETYTFFGFVWHAGIQIRFAEQEAQHGPMIPAAHRESALL